MAELHIALGQALDKVPAEQADYVEKGPYPFQCKTCQSFGGPEGAEQCDIVAGPYEDGGVEPDDSCRFWTARSAEEPEEIEEEPYEEEEE